MRVLFCSQAAHTGGGVETWMEALTSALERRGVEVFTALAKGRFHDPKRYAARHRVANPIEIDGGAGYRETRIAALLRAFGRVKPDVIIPVNLADALLAAAAAKTRGASVRLAVCIHGQGEDRIAQVRSVASFVDLAVSVSKRVTTTLTAVVEPRRVRHIPTGVPAPLSPPHIRQRLMHLGYVGRLEQAEKRVLDIVPIMTALEGVALHVVGSGPEEAALRSAMPRATFHGALARNDLYERIYPMLDAVIIPSHAEAGPIVAWEAMIHAAVPFVADFVGRTEEGVIRDGENAVVFPVGDTARAAATIRPLTASGALAPLSRGALAGLPPEYTLPVFEQSWYDALTDCVQQPMTRGPHESLPPLTSTGRLARAPWLRRLLGRRFEHGDPGSEWPH